MCFLCLEIAWCRKLFIHALLTYHAYVSYLHAYGISYVHVIMVRSMVRMYGMHKDIV